MGLSDFYNFFPVVFFFLSKEVYFTSRVIKMLLQHGITEEELAKFGIRLKAK